MREYVDPTPTNLQVFSTGRILKESWEICTKYLGALVMPTLLIIIALAIISGIVDDATNLQLGAIITNVGLIIPAMAVQCAVAELKKAGATPSFTSVIKVGLARWGRGIVVNLALVAVFVPAYLLMLLMVFPGIFLWVKTKQSYAGLLLWAGIFGAFYIGQWFMTRTCLMVSASADVNIGILEALKSGWKTSKANFKQVRQVWLSLLLIFICLFVIFAILYGVLIASKSCEEDTALGIVAILCAPFAAFFACIYWTSLSLTYQALKPAPADE